MNNNFVDWIDTLLDEKNIDQETPIEIEGKSGMLNHMTVGIVVDAIKMTTSDEQAAIKNMLVKIDFLNGSVLDYIKHLAKAIAI